MPLGLQRLNERAQRPNGHINFIKPLASSSAEDQAIAKDFLERIAAQCYPVMKKDYISVMSLEEHPPNPEFIGRNFNAGEVIQLVLKDKSGRWLSFQFVQMVMMHELAHCKQMNHSRYFWQVRNRYADQMKELWGQRYTGEGVWGRGQDLLTGEFAHDRMPDNADIPEHLCGGTYQTGRGRKRKRGQGEGDKPKLTYAERQQKRIAKKFGVHGEGHGLGEDELVRGALEQGKRHYGKPRVANSKRGRELRANAALARFEAAKNLPPEKTPELEEDDGSETESDDEDDDGFGDGLAIFNTLQRIKDQRGRELYRVCGDEGDQEEGGEKEMDELRRMGGMDGRRDGDRAKPPSGPKNDGEDSSKAATAPHDDSETENDPEYDGLSPPTVDLTHDAAHTRSSNNAIGSGTLALESNAVICPICSLENEPDSPTCMACSHVLKTSLMPNHWRCKSEQCKGSKYINSGDAGRCGVCGVQKPAAGSRAMGETSNAVLRWD